MTVQTAKDLKNVKFHMEESNNLTEITESDKTAVFPHTLRF